MDTTNIVLLCIIVIYLLFAYVQSKREQKKDSEKEKKHHNFFSSEATATFADSEREMAALAALVAAVMGDTAYSVRRIYPVPMTDEKRSSWKLTGRNESMMRRVFFKK